MARRSVTMTATGGDLVTTARTYQFSGNGLDFLGAPAMLGRLWTASEAPEGVAPPPVAVISFLFWKSHFGAAPNVIGKSLELNHQKYTVIGVVGPRFTWGDGDVYLPLPAGVLGATAHARDRHPHGSGRAAVERARSHPHLRSLDHRHRAASRRWPEHWPQRLRA